MPARIALLLLLPLPALAEPGPAPREHRSDRHGHPLPPGAVARLGVPPALAGFPSAVGWSADAGHFVTVEPGGVTIFDAATGRRVESQAIVTDSRVLYSPPARDGRFLVLVDSRTGVLYDPATAGTHTFDLPAPPAGSDRKVYSLHLSADARFLAGVAGPGSAPGVAWRYDLARGRFARIVTDRADLHSVRLSPDGRRAFATGGTAEPELTARDLVAGKELWSVRLKESGLLRAVSADGHRLAVADRDGVRVFDAATGKGVLTAAVESTTPPGLWGVDLSPDGGRLALAVDREVAVWDVASGKIKHRLPHAARLVAFAPDGRSLLTAAAWVQRWDLDTGKPMFPDPLLSRPTGATMLRWSGDGKRLFTVWPGDRRGDPAEWIPEVLAVWDVRTMDVVGRQAIKDVVGRGERPPEVRDALLDRTGSTVRLVRGAEYHVWPLAGPRAEARLKAPPINAQEQVVDFLPDGRLLALGAAGGVATVDVYDPAGTHQNRHQVPMLDQDHSSRYPGWPVVLTRGLPGVQLRPPGRRVDLTTGRVMPPLDTRGDLFILKGQPVAGGWAMVASRVQINGPWGGPLVEGVVWDAITGGEVARLFNRIPDWGLAALSADGRRLAYVSGDAVELLDLAHWHPSVDSAYRVPHRFPAVDVRALAFAPDGSRLASSHADGTVLIWEVPAPRREPWKDGAAAGLWADLGSSVAADAWKAQWHLLAHPRSATELLRLRVKPVEAWTDTADQIARLDHPRYAVRETAARELARRGMVVEGDLRAALVKAQSTEQRERLEGLLSKLRWGVAPEGEVLRGLRAVWLLERLGTDEAKRLLGRLAGGASGSRVTLEAKAALGRLK